MSMTLFLGRIHCIRPSLPLNRSAALASSKSPTQASPPNPNFAVQYLVQSCGLSSEEALKASKPIQHLKSSDKADGVLQFLREIGISESDIKSAVSREARILCSKKLRPNIAKLQEFGLSIKAISGLIAGNPYIFRTNFVQRIDFLMGVLGSVEDLSVILKASANSLFSCNLEKVLMPNLFFLKKQCALSPHQLIQLMKAYPRLLSSNPDFLKMLVERVDELGIAHSSGSFIHALARVSYHNQCAVDAKINNLRSMGFSQEEVALMIRKAPTLLGLPEKLVGNKMEYLMNEAGCYKIDVLRNPTLLVYSLENRLIPRNIVRKLLMSKRLRVGNNKFACFIMHSEENFVKKFVMPYEHVIPGLHRAYADACAGKIEGVEQFKSITS